MANYPTSAFSPTTKNAGDTIAASHVNDLQNEVTAVETALLTSGLAHHLLFVDATYDIGASGATRPRNLYLSGLVTAGGFGTHSFSAGGTGANALHVVNPTAGTANNAYVAVGNDQSALQARLQVFSSTYTTSGRAVADGALLENDGAGGLSIAANHASGAIRFYSGGTTLRAQINTNGTQTWAPYGAGTATFDGSGNITSVSDARFKDRIAPLPYGLAAILALRPVQHGYNKRSGLDRNGLYGGFLAQEVEQVIPLAVGRNADGYLTLADRPILGALVNSIHELHARVSTLESR